MASEDSDQVLPGLAPIHRLRYLSDLNQTVRREMPTVADELHARCKLLEVIALRSTKLMTTKERDDRVS
jgi:hypothetical protein